jgi:DNA-directed RNA polymerase
MLLAIAENPFDNRQWEDADKKAFQAVAACKEWAGYKANGLKHVSRIPVALDGSCSGLQNFGMALRCEVTGKAVNLLPAATPSDIYQDVIDKVQGMLLEITQGKCAQITPEAIRYQAREQVRVKYGQSTDNFEAWLLSITERQFDEEGMVIKLKGNDLEAATLYWNVIAAFAWLQYGVDKATGKMSRKIAKRAVMTFPYGSKEFGFRDQLLGDIVKPDIAKHSDLDGTSSSVFAVCEWKASGLMAALLWKAVNQVVVKAAEAMDWLQKAAALVAKEGTKVSWKTPLGFIVEQGYVTSEESLVKTSFAGIERIRLTLPLDTVKPDTRKQTSGIAPNFVHSLDSSHLLLTVARAPDINNWALIHDSFGTLPSRTPALFRYIRVAFLELYSQHDVLDDFRGQMIKQLSAESQGDMPDLPTPGKLDLHAVLHSQYCFA